MSKFKNQLGFSDTISMLIVSAIIAVIFIGGVFVWQEVNGDKAISNFLNIWREEVSHKTLEPAMNNFADCLAEGNTILESYPRQCVSKEGRVFVEDLGEAIVDNTMIKVAQPQVGQFISSPLTIKGQAKGPWFFEASFPIVLTDEEGNEISTVVATAQDDWMTEDMVDFEAELIFDKPDSNKGFLIFRKDNPSGLAENDDSITLPIFFQ